MPRIVHFEIPAKDPEKAVEFYGSIFGWNIEKFPGPMEYWLAYTGEKGTPGIDGAIYKAGEMFDVTVNTINVPDLKEYIEKVSSAGGTVLTDVMTIPRVGYFVYCKDLEGVPFGMMQEDPEAGE